MATDVYYNGVWLHNVQTREFRQDATYDQSNTDQLSQHYRMRFEGIIHVQAPADAGDGGSDVPFVFERGNWVAPETLVGTSQAGLGSPAEMYAQVRARMMQPRRKLAVWVNNQALFLCVGTGTETLANPDRDVKNGPRPVAFNINQIVANNVFRVSFEVECEKVECGLLDPELYGSADIPYILSNRWSLSESLGNDHFITRTIQGRMVLSASSWWDSFATQPQGLAGHLMKAAVVPGLEDGFRRESIDFQVDPTGLNCAYIIQDRQVTTAAPYPLSRMEGEHTETVHDGLQFFSSASVTVYAPPHVDKRVLIARALQFLDSKLLLTLPGHVFYLISGSVTEQFGELNSVRAEAKIIHNNYGGTNATITKDEIVGAFQTPFSFPLSFPPMGSAGEVYDPQVSHSPSIHGYCPQGYTHLSGVRDPAVTAMLHCYLQEPCCVTHSPDPYQVAYAYQDSHGAQQATQVKQVEAFALPQGVDVTPLLSPDHLAMAYTQAEYRSRYFNPQMRIQLPIASTVSNEDESEDEDAEDTSRVIQLSRPICRREILYEASRIGDWPKIPKPIDAYADGTLKGKLMDYSVTPLAPTMTADKRFNIYRLRARYEYAMNRPPRPDEALRVGWLPYRVEPVPGGDSLTLTAIANYGPLAPGPEETEATTP